MQPHELYQLAKSLHPDGVTGLRRIPFELKGLDMELRIFTERGNGNEVQFDFFLTNARYSRRSIIIWENGHVEDNSVNDESMVPQFDLKDYEPPALSVNEVLQIIERIIRDPVVDHHS